MHRHRIVAQISLILSILNLVLATPIVVQEIHEARGNEMVVAEDVPAIQKKSGALDAASNRPRSPPTPTNPDAMSSPQHSSLSDGPTSSDYHTPHSSLSSVSLQEPASLHPSSPGPSELPFPAWYLHALEPQRPESPSAWSEWPSSHSSGSGSSELQIPSWYLNTLAAQNPENPPAWSEWPPPPPHHSSSGSSELPPPQEIPPSPHPQMPQSPTWWESPLTGSTDWNSGESMLSTPYLSASGGSLSSHYFSGSASEELVPSHHSMPGGLAPSLIPDESPQSLIPDGSPPSHSPLPAETPPDNAEFFNESMMKKLKIFAGVVIISGVIASIAGTQIKHRDCEDS